MFIIYMIDLSYKIDLWFFSEIWL